LLAGQKLAPEPPADGEAPNEAKDQAGAEQAPPEDSELPPAWVGHRKLPFGPFLALGALEYLFFGPPLVALWLDLFARLFS
jgi:hypothetical protein